MKEYTVVTTVELTEVIPVDVFDEEVYKEELLASILVDVGVDDAHIKSCKTFEREVES